MPDQNGIGKVSNGATAKYVEFAAGFVDAG